MMATIQEKTVAPSQHWMKPVTSSQTLKTSQSKNPSQRPFPIATKLTILNYAMSIGLLLVNNFLWWSLFYLLEL